MDTKGERVKEKRDRQENCVPCLQPIYIVLHIIRPPLLSDTNHSQTQRNISDVYFHPHGFHPLSPSFSQR